MSKLLSSSVINASNPLKKIKRKICLLVSQNKVGSNCIEQTYQTNESDYQKKKKKSYDFNKLDKLYQNQCN